MNFVNFYMIHMCQLIILNYLLLYIDANIDIPKPSNIQHKTQKNIHQPPQSIIVLSTLITNSLVKYSDLSQMYI